MVTPYTKAFSESFKNIYNKHGTKVHFKGSNTIKNLLVAPKDKDSMIEESGVIYRYKYDRVECDEVCVGKSARPFGERLKEHLKALPPFMNIATLQATILELTISV